MLGQIIVGFGFLGMAAVCWGTRNRSDQHTRGLSDVATFLLLAAAVLCWVPDGWLP